jgi:ribosomal-protein-serine acetyltransferase
VFELGKGARLRPVVHSDGARMFLQIEKSRAHLRAWLPWVDAVETADDLSVFLNQSARFHRQGIAVRLVLEVEGEIAGVIGLENIDERNGHAELGYWIARQYQGNGWMTIATGVLCEYAFRERELHRLVIRAMPTNRRSRAVAERLGFMREGTARECTLLHGEHVDLTIYSMLAHEWGGL